MLYAHRKTILITLLVIIVLVVSGVVTYMLLHKEKKPTGPSYNVNTTGLTKTPTPLPDSTMELIKESVNRVVTTRHGQGAYTAIYRDGSYKRIVYPSGAISMSVLVDVQETKETYIFIRTGGDNATASTTYTHCAPESDQMVHPSVCKDPAEGY